MELRALGPAEPEYFESLARGLEEYGRTLVEIGVRAGWDRETLADLVDAPLDDESMAPRAASLDAGVWRVLQEGQIPDEVIQRLRKSATAIREVMRSDRGGRNVFVRVNDVKEYFRGLAGGLL
jgi:hypothetical protein